MYMYILTCKTQVLCCAVWYMYIYAVLPVNMCVILCVCMWLYLFMWFYMHLCMWLYYVCFSGSGVSAIRGVGGAVGAGAHSISSPSQHNAIQPHAAAITTLQSHNHSALHSSIQPPQSLAIAPPQHAFNPHFTTGHSVDVDAAFAQRRSHNHTTPQRPITTSSPSPSQTVRLPRDMRVCHSKVLLW